ncbi:MAG: FAD-dependent oxidoreductase [Clostridiaceae bacterium]|nr:FAD-dependent oxidoreductase [Clostridiaceae bacterium]
MTQLLYPYKALFSPLRVNSITLKNRLVMAPMGNISMTEETGRPDRSMIAYYEERAKGGAGLITSGLVPVSFGIDHSLTEPGGLTYFPKILGSRTYLAGWRDLAHVVHAAGAHFFIQLSAGLGRVGNPQCLVNQRKFPVSSSFNPNYYLPQVPCLRLSDRKLKQIIRNFGQAAADAKLATIDGVYLHGHEGYLLEQLANTAFNRRKIGRFANWQRFGLDLVKEIRKRTGSDYPIMYRIDLSLALNATFGDRMETVKPLRKFRNERLISQTLDYMKNLVTAGVDLFDVDLGCYDNWWLPHPPATMKPGLFLEAAALVRQYFQEEEIMSNKGLPVPVAAVGKLGYPDLAEKALADGSCDLVMLGRPLLADPQWPNKAYAGRVADIRPCIGCQEACINEFILGGRPQCAVNPRTSYELTLPAEIRPAGQTKKIAVVGAGPAGFECAMAALARGHQVHLFDQQTGVGGMVRLAALPSFKRDLRNYLEWMERTAARAQRDEPDFILKTGTEATLKVLTEGQYDTIVCATGSRNCLPDVEGIDLAITARDLLLDPSRLDGKQKITVVGGGSTGCELAFMVAAEYGLKVTVIEKLPYLMEGICTANRGHLIHELEKCGVRLMNCTELEAIDFGRVTVRTNRSPSVPDPYNSWSPLLPDNVPNPFNKPIQQAMETEELESDLVLIATGTLPQTDLYRLLVDSYAAPDIKLIGDASRPDMITQAVRAGYRTGISL